MPTNVVIIDGNLTSHPEIRSLPSGDEVAEFCIAWNNRYKDANGEFVEDEPMFVEVNSFGKSVAYVKNNLAKGCRVVVQGRLRQDRWLNKDDGQKRTKLYVVSDHIDVIKRPNSEATQDDGTSTAGVATGTAPANVGATAGATAGTNTASANGNTRRR
jgi:single-strand DNA-binding protein